MKLVEKEARGRYVFVGDTHGDLDASERVFERYQTPDTTFVFLGDYVDRGPRSKENADFLLGQRESNPDSVYLLQGNHENYMSTPLRPSNFWDSLANDEERWKYSNAFRQLPLVFSVGDIIATHGALPDVSQLKDVENIMERDRNWIATLWGNFYDFDGIFSSGGKPSFSHDYFNRVMRQVGKKVLIRGHQPDTNISMSHRGFLTLITSNYDKGERTIAIADFNKNKRIRSIDDLTIEII
ncbi:MAG: serine/threonine protein phosphatase [Nanoarchaeota archaeon]|nr:serine/threonine protein phosphatase [Nanoarchaeota archaeon]